MHLKGTLMKSKSVTWNADAYHLTGTGWRQRLTPYRSVSDLLGKRWMEGAVPLSLAIALSVAVLLATPVGLGDGPLIMDDTAERGLLAIALTVVLVGGGIDLSVGSIVGLTSIAALVASRAWEVPMLVVAPAAILLGALLGSINGFLIARLNMRPFITTLVTLVAFSGVTGTIQTKYTLQLSLPSDDPLWTFLGDGAIVGVPIGWAVFALVLVVAHVALTRSRWGWWVTAVGSDRRSARRNGIPVDRITFSTYVISGALAGTAGLLTAARLGRTDPGVGSGWELTALTAVVLGGVSLKGGRGSVLRAAIGMLVVQVILQATIVMGVEGSYNTTILALALLSFAVLDLKWGKYRASMASKLKIDPGVLTLGPLVDVTRPGTIWSLNDKLTDAPPIGLGQIQGAEDLALDGEGNLYCGDRRGWIWKFAGPDHEHGEVWSRTGGLPLGHAWDADGNLVVAVGGMGVYRITPDGEPHLVANRVKRSRFSLHDDSALKFADDLDVAPDGAIFVSDFSTRTNAAEFMVETVEFRPNGRIIRIDPDGSTDVVVTNYVFPNGVCTAHDGESVLISSTGMCRVDRLWISGPRQGQMEPVLENLPGYPDNINRASDGSYWMTFVAMRTPMSDLMIRYPGVRRRMTRELPLDSWVVPQLNVSCVFKFNEQGEILDVLWDRTLENYPMITSCKEHGGALYLAGLNNNRVGRLALSPAQVGPVDPGAVPTLAGVVHERSGVLS